MSREAEKDQTVRSLILAALAETMCLIAGVAAYLFSDQLVWLFTGLLAGLGFSIPALIRFCRIRKERDDASR